MADVETTRQIADPLPYIIIFGILFLVALVAFTWMLDMWYKANQCFLYPNIWCSDNWTCNNSCPTGLNVSECFINLGPTGLASCLYGPDAPGARVCLTPPSETGGVACPCPAEMQGIANCFSGCAQNLNTTTGSVCCCKGPSPCTPTLPQCLGTT